MNLALRYKTHVHLSDAEHDNAVEQVLAIFPNIGYQSVKGHLHSMGEILQDQRVGPSMPRVDPDSPVP